ncbi:hypothetical protein B0P06_000991 [Clostridium saccharoperbutylacetonicum]|jgi:hypothetical protein|uniref:Cell wall binding repeat-containing protein n=1 Tax=Clostridium saccharoperbutylacetonicum N1-4(HMT) TaxID=931276 RepID=M1MJA4_9CLOT|nr:MULTISPECIES: cell wall-binding repeat-containing protein [Clostridium]AGF54931.1 cell wall binding repeat-containing protein [Clostridium saccharoperbutylacetonicum N1-4(HMT)]NRT64364.1 hypothetical protein [Clostridium saccharoperbutylacetonicum]NSB27733.1 hypothetical protein [Clostridium saccharoperbutylacetonicum]NSB41220.1 hypothetical protein [Clostridium saccharoperbutylacetonicum]
MIKKLVCSVIATISIIMLIPIGASAEWKSDNHGWWYTEGSSYITGWKQINNLWYYFGADGYMQKGWIKDGAWWYYLKDNGVMATGKISIKDKTYEFYDNGRWKNNYLPSRESLKDNSMKPSAKTLEETSDFSWFEEHGNKYFKILGGIYAYGGWNIDGDLYVFDKNGVLQKGEYTGQSGNKYLLGEDGKFVKGITYPEDELWVETALTTKSTTDKNDVKLDDSNMMNLNDPYSKDLAAGNGTTILQALDYKLENKKSKPKIEGKTLYCKVKQSIYLGNIKVSSENSKSSALPNLMVMASSTDENVVYSAVDLGLEDGFYKNIYPKIEAYKAGKATITISVNGAKTTFDVIVTE